MRARDRSIAPEVNLRLVWPQWQGGGTVSVQQLASEFPLDIGRRGYAVGSAVLEAAADRPGFPPHQRLLGARVGLLGQAVCEVNGGFGGLLQAEPMLQNQTREEAGIDASVKIMAGRYGRECSRVIDKAGGVVEAGSLDGELPEAAHPLWRVKKPPGCA